MFDYTLIKYKKTVWLPASDWSCRVVSLGFFVMKQERPGMMHLKNVTKNSWLLLRPALEPREERALRGSGRVAAAGRGPGRCLRRRGKEDPGPAGRCPGRDELLKAGSSSPRSPFASPPPSPEHTEAPGPTPHRVPRTRRGGEPEWVWSAGHVPGTPRPMPGPRTCPLATGFGGHNRPPRASDHPGAGWAELSD